MRPCGIDEQIALMHVGVKQAVAQGVAQERLDQAAPELRRIETCACQPVRIGQGQAVDPFEGQHFARRAVPIDCRHAKIGIVADIFGEFGSRRRLQAKIHLDAHGPRERLDDLDRLQTAHLRRQSLRQPGGEKHVGRDRGRSAARRPAAGLSPRRRASSRRPERGRDAPGRSRRPRPASPNSTNSVSSFAPKAASIVATATLRGWGDTRSCSRSSWATTLGPTISARVERNWPSFT